MEGGREKETERAEEPRKEGLSFEHEWSEEPGYKWLEYCVPLGYRQVI